MCLIIGLSQWQTTTTLSAWAVGMPTLCRALQPNSRPCPVTAIVPLPSLLHHYCCTKNPNVKQSQTHQTCRTLLALVGILKPRKLKVQEGRRVVALFDVCTRENVQGQICNNDKIVGSQVVVVQSSLSEPITQYWLVAMMKTANPFGDRRLVIDRRRIVNWAQTSRIEHWTQESRIEHRTQEVGH